jgi:hypothetical protein
VQAGGNATANPAVVHAAASIPGPDTSAGATAAPAVVLATAAVHTPTTVTFVAATPAAVQAFATIPAALISTTARPPTVAAVATIPSPAVSTGQVGDIHARLGDQPAKRRWTSPTADRDWGTTRTRRRWTVAP